MVAVLVAAPATTAVASPPALDQYTSKFPGAGGNSGLASGSAPVAEPGLLSAKTRAALAGPDGQLLTQIATAPGLGAPDVSSKASGSPSDEGRAFGTAVADTIASGPSLVLIGALAAIALAAAGAHFVRRRRATL
jgi:hypothetical protein